VLDSLPVNLIWIPPSIFALVSSWPKETERPLKNHFCDGAFPCKIVACFDFPSLLFPPPSFRASSPLFRAFSSYPYSGDKTNPRDQKRTFSESWLFPERLFHERTLTSGDRFALFRRSNFFFPVAKSDVGSSTPFKGNSLPTAFARFEWG